MCDSLPFVSIVTPCLNSVDSIAACLASVAAQTYGRVEHIVIDGGSTDGTVDVLAAHPDIEWVSEPDEGQSDAINKGMRRATGVLLSWINADDRLEPDAVERAVEAWCVSKFDKAVIYRDCRVEEPDRTWIWKPTPAVTLEALACGDPVPQPGTFFTQAAWESCGRLSSDFHLALDFDLWLRMFLAGTRFVHGPGVGATFTVTPSSKTGSQSRGRFLAEEVESLRRCGLYQAADVAAGRVAFCDQSQQLPASPEGRAGFALERLRAARTAGPLSQVVASCRPSLWSCAITRRHLLGQLRRQVWH